MRRERDRGRFATSPTENISRYLHRCKADVFRRGSENFRRNRASAVSRSNRVRWEIAVSDGVAVKPEPIRVGVSVKVGVGSVSVMVGVSLGVT